MRELEIASTDNNVPDVHGAPAGDAAPNDVVTVDNVARADDAAHKDGHLFGTRLRFVAAEYKEKVMAVYSNVGQMTME